MFTKIVSLLCFSGPRGDLGSGTESTYKTDMWNGRVEARVGGFHQQLGSLHIGLYCGGPELQRYLRWVIEGKQPEPDLGDT